MKKSLPIWLTIVIVVETLPMFIGPAIALLNPESFPGLRTMADPRGMAWIYAARNFAVGIAFIVAFVLKNRSMLFILILVRLITDLHDLPNFLILGNPSSSMRLIAIFVFLYYLPALYALRYLWREIRGEQPASRA